MSPTTVLLVDDEANILAGVRRLLHPWRDQVRLTLAHGGDEAIEALDSSPYDAVVSDLRMPGVGGAAVLAHARATRPETVRIVLSGYADQSVADTALVAHRFLAKPCDPERLIATVGAVGELKALIPRTDLRRPLGAIATLPAAPSILAAVGSLLGDEPTAERLAAAMAGDVALTAGLLHLVGASGPGPVGGRLDAAGVIAYLGLPVVRRMVAAFDAAAAASGRSGPAAFVPALAERLARHPGPGGRSAFGPAVRDLGLLALAAAQPDQMAGLLGPPGSPDGDLLERERAGFGVDHLEVGRYLARLWDLPATVEDPEAPARPPGRPERTERPGADPVPGDGAIRIDDLRPSPPPARLAVTPAGPAHAAIDVPRGGI